MLAVFCLAWFNWFMLKSWNLYMKTATEKVWEEKVWYESVGGVFAWVSQTNPFKYFFINFCLGRGGGRYCGLGRRGGEAHLDQSDFTLSYCHNRIADTCFWIIPVIVHFLDDEWWLVALCHQPVFVVSRMSTFFISMKHGKILLYSQNNN